MEEKKLFDEIDIAISLALVFGLFLVVFISCTVGFVNDEDSMTVVEQEVSVNLDEITEESVVDEQEVKVDPDEVTEGSVIEVSCGVPLGELKSLEYRGVDLFWEEGHSMPEERLEIFYRVIDSLTDDLQYKYSIKTHEVTFYYLTEESYYAGSIGPFPLNSSACQRGDEIFLSPLLVDSNRPLYHNEYQVSQYGPRQNFNDYQVYDPGFFAMVLVHEYVHIVHTDLPQYHQEYWEDVGWEKNEEGFLKPEDEESHFYNVLSDYSLYNPSEDMAETYMFSYLCGNNLEDLSEARLQHVEDFWGVPREQYCQNFH